ncbi:DUF4157 domain-containing protein [Phormidium sp. CLA17]|nr:DUF4157 domain-containing protein [Leptolyngbya sp. Cla-17]
MPVDVFTHAPQRSPVQMKLTVGAPNDVYEQEADRVAQQVMSMAPPATPHVQRRTDEEEIQTKPLVETITPLVQRQEAEEDEPIQAKCEDCQAEEPIQRFGDSPAQAQPDLENRLNASQGGGNALPDEVRSFMEPRFGADFSQVRVHTGSEAAQMNRDLNAQAFTHKQDVYFGSGKAPAKDELTAHELTHVVQQTSGVRQKLTVGQPNDQYEQEAQRSYNGVPQVQADLDGRLNANKGGDSPLPDKVRSLGGFEPGTNEVRRLLAHGLTHVVQQGGIGELQAKSFSVQERQVDRAAMPLTVQRQKNTPSKPRNITIPIGPSDTVVFRTSSVALGTLRVYITGRMAIRGKGLLTNEEMPRKDADLKARVREVAKTAFDATKPTGDPKKIEMVLGGQTLTLELAAGAEQSLPFQVSGRFENEKIRLTFTECEITEAMTTLDATVWIEPPAKTGASTTTTPGDASVQRYAFAGSEAAFGGFTARKGTVVLKSAMEAFDARLPDFVKQIKFLNLPEQRAAFFQEMRAYFGTDENTVAHFARMRKANVKGATTWLHDKAATRLEAVQAELGDAMPTSGGVGWPRAECKLSGKQGLGNLHNIGYAVDYNAYQTPHLKDQRILDMIQIVTGGSASLSYETPKGLDTRQVGETFTGGTDEEKAKLEADPKVKEWLDNIGKGVETLSKTSEDFRASLTTTNDKKEVVDLAPKLQELREKWFAAIAAKNEEEKQAVLAELLKVIKPWLDKVETQRKTTEKKITDVGLNPADLPSDKKLTAAITAVQGLAKRMQTLQDKLGATLKKGQGTQVDKLIAEARKLLAEAVHPLADDAAAVAELNRLLNLVNQRQAALVQKKWLDRVSTLQGALTGNPSFVFGATADKAVSNPPLTQLVDQGFFTLRGKPGTGKGAFDVNFVKSMAKHGFNLGATWSTPDSMHFELRWKGPGQS